MSIITVAMYVVADINEVRPLSTSSDRSQVYCVLICNEVTHANSVWPSLRSDRRDEYWQY